jgi:hypothetical protein
MVAEVYRSAHEKVETEKRVSALRGYAASVEMTILWGK